MSFLDYSSYKILYVYKISRKAGRFRCSSREWATISFRLSGQSIFYSGSQEWYAVPGSVLYVPAGMPFSRESTDEELIIIHVKNFEETSGNIEVVDISNFSQEGSFFADIYNIWEAKEAGYKHKSTSVLYALLAELKQNQDAPSYKQRLIKQGVDYIESNFDSPEISIARVAKLCNMSEEYFRKLYKAAYGVSPHNAIIDKRIKKACRLLCSGYFSVGEVAAQCGFSDSEYFSTAFRRVMGVSPKEYKRNEGVR